MSRERFCAEKIFTFDCTNASVMFTLNCKGNLLVAEQPIVMGIINVTPDSFFEGSRVMDKGGILKQAEKMLHDGAAILDIGGESTRPGAKQVSITEELDRVMPAIELVHSYFPKAVISIDTYHAHVAREAIAIGAGMINDISGGNADEAMLSSAAEMGVPYVCMHMKGEPQTMQKNPRYENILTELLDYFIGKKDQCRASGIKDIILDPGFGFGKTIQHNFEILNNLDVFGMLECPLLIGISRKSSIYKTLGVTANEALNGTTALHTIALMKGASILRVHDVKEAVETIRMVNAVTNADRYKK